MSTVAIKADLTPLPQEPPKEWLLFPYGENTARWMDGKEHTFDFKPEQAARVMAAYKRGGRELSLDYNHASLDPKAGERERRAAGTFQLEQRDDGLWMTDIRYTEDAESYVRKREYPFISPVWNRDKAGPLEVINVALTPNPALLGIKPLIASQHHSPQEEENTVKLETLKASLGLPEDTTEDEALQTVAALQTFQGSVLELAGSDDRDSALGTLQAWHDKAAQVDTLQASLDQITQERETQERETLIASALSSRKLTPAQKEWASSVPVATLKSYLASAPTVVPDEIPETEPDAETQLKWSEMSYVEKANLSQSDPELYAQLKAEHNAGTGE